MGATCTRCFATNEERQPRRTSVSPSSTNKCKLDVHSNPESIRSFYQIDDHVKSLLDAIYFVNDPDQYRLRNHAGRLHCIAESSRGWLALSTSLIETIPISAVVGTGALSFILEECALHTKDCVALLLNYYSIGAKPVSVLNQVPHRWRNVCVALGCLAEKLAGPKSVALLTNNVIEFLLSCLETDVCLDIVLHAIIAIEKFSKTQKNKSRFEHFSIASILHRFSKLSKCSLGEQIVFCSNWLLDNTFVLEGRSFGYETVDISVNNAVLNCTDVSENLKLSPDGLTARCDTNSFESVRSSVVVSSGVYYYEAFIISSGIMQIGWATKNSDFFNFEGYGIGDDKYSMAYDGCRSVIWFDADTRLHKHPRWKYGDVIGCLIDTDSQEVVFYYNGEPLASESDLFKESKSGFYAGASLMSFEQCRFNFGATSFSYPPCDRVFQPLNAAKSIIDDSEKVILPRHIVQQKLLNEVNSLENPCIICCAQQANTTLLPCKHGGICMSCAMQLEICTICRVQISERIESPS